MSEIPNTGKPRRLLRCTATAPPSEAVFNEDVDSVPSRTESSMHAAQYETRPPDRKFVQARHRGYCALAKTQSEVDTAVWNSARHVAELPAPGKP